MGSRKSPRLGGGGVGDGGDEGCGEEGVDEGGGQEQPADSGRKRPRSAAEEAECEEDNLFGVG